MVRINNPLILEAYYEEARVEGSVPGSVRGVRQVRSSKQDGCGNAGMWSV
ncbi:hypothetical protein SEA_BIG4_54 [Microbacterium phage Big4]|nr:hypothetical protein SEA_BIG4_54 [Microbacterium phage Big4]